jgi:hypothetical protein
MIYFDIPDEDLIDFLQICYNGNLKVVDCYYEQYAIDDTFKSIQLTELILKYSNYLIDYPHAAGADTYTPDYLNIRQLTFPNEYTTHNFLEFRNLIIDDEFDINLPIYELEIPPGFNMDWYNANNIIVTTVVDIPLSHKQMIIPSSIVL